jgi:hypothetical protein
MRILKRCIGELLLGQVHDIVINIIIIIIIITITLEPKSCGATENEMAFVDITKAYTIVNSNNDMNSGTGKAVVSLYHSLRSSLKEQREKDKNNMKRLLAKPIDDIDIDAIDNNDTTESSSNHKPNMTLYDALAKVKVLTLVILTIL